MSRELFRHLRRAKLDILLSLIANTIREMFNRDESVKTIPVVRFDGPVHQAGNVTVTAWNLSDLAYLAIQESSDFHTWEPSVDDLIGLCNFFLAWDEDRSRIEFEGLTKDEQILKLGVGFPLKQFWYQESYRITEEFNRQVELLEVIPSEMGSEVDLNGICEEVTGFDLHTFRTILFALFSVVMRQSDLSRMTSNGTAANLHPALTARNFLHVAEMYTGDYQEFRESTLLENHFYIKPIVRTSSNSLLAVNAYMFGKKVADGPLWIIRDYYHNLGSQVFVNAFGEYFDRYVEKLLQKCLPSENFSRVPAPRSGRYADWFVYTKHYRIIVELKSSLAALMMRRLYPDLDTIRNYLEKLQEGVLQLDSTTKAYPETARTDIKLLVHYETFHLSDGVLRPLVVNAVRNQIANDEYIYFCDIGEFEWFISLLRESEAVAEKILAAKIDLESQPGAGRQFGQIIPRFTSTGNLYIHRTLNYWHTYIPGLAGN